jgi:hypothetical protein
MKKSIVILSMVIGTLSLTAFVVISQPTSESEKPSELLASEDKTIDREESVPSKVTVDFVYDIGSRFGSTITKEDLHRATRISDILPKGVDWSHYPAQKLKVRVLKYKSERTEFGTDLHLNLAQLALLKSTEYSDDLQLLASNAGEHDLNYMFTVVPEKEAKYNQGQVTLVDYLKKNSEEVIAGVVRDKLKPGKILFTVNTQGAISTVLLTESSGYESVDQTMIELLKEAPGSWEPATNAKGEKVEQKITFSFGIMGC